MIWVGIALAGALGAAARYVVDHVVSVRASDVFPWGTAVVNVTGSLLAGIVVGLASSAVVPHDLQVLVAGGFLGAYTTFSTAMYETVRLLEDGDSLRGSLNLLGPLVVSFLAAMGGWLLTA